MRQKKKKKRRTLENWTPTFLCVGSVIFRLHMAVCGRPFEVFASFRNDRRPQGSWPRSLICSKKWRQKTKQKRKHISEVIDFTTLAYVEFLSEGKATTSDSLSRWRTHGVRKQRKQNGGILNPQHRQYTRSMFTSTWTRQPSKKVNRKFITHTKKTKILYLHGERKSVFLEGVEIKYKLLSTFGQRRQVAIAVHMDGLALQNLNEAVDKKKKKKNWTMMTKGLRHRLINETMNQVLGQNSTQVGPSWWEFLLVASNTS